MSQGEAYSAQCNMMLANARRWQEEHPNASIMVHFKFPKTVAIVGCISDGIAQGFVSTNKDGLDFIKAFGPWGVPEEPTVLMVRAVIEVWQEKAPDFVR